MSAEQNRKLETRLMKVTMSPEDFKKFDRGEAHSNRGVRDKRGSISALPDIAPVTEEDLPKRIEERLKQVLVEPPKPSFGQMVIEVAISTIGNEIIGFINSPTTRSAINKWANHIINGKREPDPDSKESTLQSAHNDDSSQDLEIAPQFHPETSYEIETVNDHNERIIVTGEQAARLVEGMRQKAKEYTAFIFLLSNICIKDEKTNTEYVMEEACIKQLVSDEAQSTMRSLIANRQLLEEDTAICIDEWLNGYIRNGDQRLPIPLIPEKEPEQKEMNQS